MATMSAALGHPERDPALLAFIKCHLTSMTRWNILRVLSQDPGYHWSVDEVARQAHGSGDGTRSSLEELAAEGLVERYDGPDGPSYVVVLVPYAALNEVVRALARWWRAR